MKTLIVTAAFASVLALSGLAHAAQISSPLIFGGHFQELAECVVLNAGTRPVTVTSVKIVDDNGQTRSSQTCAGPLAAGEFCQIVAHIDFNNSFGCVVTAPSTTSLRASVVLDQFAFDDFFVKNVRPMTSAPLE